MIFIFRIAKHVRISKIAMQNIIKAGSFDFADANRKRLLSIISLHCQGSTKYAKRSVRDAAITGLSEENCTFGSYKSDLLEKDFNIFEKMTGRR
jgi:DNA polymerase III alpha subunit